MMADFVPIVKGSVSIRVTFLSTDSKWKQGILLGTKGDFFIIGKKLPYRIVLWEHAAPKVVDIEICSINKELKICNAWDTGDGTVHYGHFGGAMYLEKDGESYVFHCNDGEPDDDFSDLVFKIDFL